jgi:dipeptidyl-peptidase-4
VAVTPSSPIEPAEIARRPLPGEGVPTGFAFSPSGRFLSFLDDPAGGLERRLYLLDLEDLTAAPRAAAPRPAAPREAAPREITLAGETDPEELPLEEQLRRERTRELGRGVPSATWASHADVLLVPLATGPIVLNGLPDSFDPTAVDLPGDAITPTLSPDGKLLAFVSAGELFVTSVAGDGELRQLTSGATDGLTHGLAEYIAQEEMDRSEGFWWSPDSASLAYTEVDERAIPPYRIVHQGSDSPFEEESHRYPFAGGPNAGIRLGVVPASGGETTWMDTGDDDTYLANVHWINERTLVAEIESRDQRRLDVISFDVSTGKGHTLHTETGEPYLNLHKDYHRLETGEWLWSSERTGFRHLEVRAEDGELLRVLTSGPWQVDALGGVNEANHTVYFTATKEDPTERHLYAVPLEGGECRRLTPERGTHRVVVSSASPFFVDRHSALDSPPAVSVRSVSDGLALDLHRRSDPRIAELGLEPPELVTLEAADGTPLRALVYRPPDSGPAPLVVFVYGGPHVQLAVDDWSATAALRPQALARSGIAVMCLDNRGSARRGLEFEKAVYGHLGELEVEDQKAGVAWAVAEGIADPDRVAVYGGSYGGYMTLRCLELAPEVFRAGCASAPVSDWDGYDTHYTERYMGKPASNRDGYAESSALTYAGRIRGELLLVHGLIDENVHFRHTARLINRLVERGIAYRLVCFPEERHMPRREEDRAFLEERVLSFLKQALGTEDSAPQPHQP